MDVRRDLNSIASLLEQLRQNNAAIMLDRVSVAVAELIEAATELEKEFRRVFPVYYYAEPWAHDRNAPLKAMQVALAAIGAAK